MTDALVAEVRAIQESMIEAGRSDLFDSDPSHMRGIVRLTVEFHHFLKGEDILPKIDDARLAQLAHVNEAILSEFPELKAEDLAETADDRLRYVYDSIFSGVGSFVQLHYTYRKMPSPRATTLAAGAKSVESVREEFASKYVEFSSATDFEFRFGLLLGILGILGITAQPDPSDFLAATPLTNAVQSSPRDSFNMVGQRGAVSTTLCYN
jgi:hypothetical protein